MKTVNKMTIDEQILVMQAFKDGKEIECKMINVPDDTWDLAPFPSWNFSTRTYRVKPDAKPEYNGVAYIITPKGYSVFIGTESYVVDKDHPNYLKISDSLKSGDYADLKKLINAKAVVEKFGEGKLTVQQGVVRYNGKELHGCITTTVLKLIKDGFTVTPLVKLLDNLSLNPSYRAVNELYEFLEVGNLPITSDGCFVAYKKVRSDYKDIYSGKFDNSIGAKPTMPRNEVDEDSDRTCSSGLHACSYDYLKHFGSCPDNKVVAVKINPKDVVSIPKDYNNSKLRCCEYEVIADVTDEYNKSHNVLSDSSLYGDIKDDYEDDVEYCDRCGIEAPEGCLTWYHGDYICDDCNGNV